MNYPLPKVEGLSVEEIARELAEHHSELVEVEARSEGQETADVWREHALRDRIGDLEGEIERRDSVYQHALGPDSASNALAAAQAAMGGGS